jgi:hypothetical protein
MVNTEKIEITQAESSKAPMPAKFDATNWVAWEIVFSNYLSGIYGLSKGMLSGVTCRMYTGS